MKKEKGLTPSHKLEAKTTKSPAFEGVYWITHSNQKII